MKAYRCIVNFSNGHTTIEVAADDPDGAICVARETVSVAEACSIEVYDTTGLVLRANPKEYLRRQ
jgi:hypothetical protein